MGEYWDVLNEQGEKTGKRLRRTAYNQLASGEYHLVVHIWIVNSKGEFLIQRRSRERLPMPGEWAATGGSVLSGEESQAAAIRELQEELGIRVLPGEIHYLRQFKRKNSIIDFWWARVDANLSSLVLDSNEVEEARWVSRSTLRQMIQQKQFHNYGRNYFSAVFSLPF